MMTTIYISSKVRVEGEIFGYLKEITRYQRVETGDRLSLRPWEIAKVSEMA